MIIEKYRDNMKMSIDRLGKICYTYIGKFSKNIL